MPEGGTSLGESGPTRTPPFDLTGRRVWVAGHRGMVGSALMRRLDREPIADIVRATSEELDLRDPRLTIDWVKRLRPDVAIIAAARVGGIHANRSSPATFIHDNVMIGANTIEACRIAGVGRITVLGSSCIYPRDAPQPIREHDLLTGPLEETNRAYAIAKIATLELARTYRQQFDMDIISLMPTNLYGPGDNFDLSTAHVLPALIRRIHEAQLSDASTVTLWGTGTPRREFMHVDDMADATIHLVKHYDDETHVNVGTGHDVTISELAKTVAEVVGWDGSFVFDHSMPNGTPRKLLDVSRLSATGWAPQVDLRDGIAATYAWFIEHGDAVRGVSGSPGSPKTETVAGNTIARAQS